MTKGINILATNEQWNLSHVPHASSLKPIINHPIPHQTWTKTVVDPFHLYGHYYLLMIIIPNLLLKS